MELLRKTCAELHAAIVMVTHDPRAASFADRVIFIKDGRMVKELQNAAGRPAWMAVKLPGTNQGPRWAGLPMKGVDGAKCEVRQGPGIISCEGWADPRAQLTKTPPTRIVWRCLLMR